jgi:hypothetical protein
MAVGEVPRKTLYDAIDRPLAPAVHDSVICLAEVAVAARFAGADGPPCVVADAVADMGETFPLESTSSTA